MTPAQKIKLVAWKWTAIIALPVIILIAAVTVLWVVNQIYAQQWIESFAECLIKTIARLFEKRQHKVRMAGYYLLYKDSDNDKTC